MINPTIPVCQIKLNLSNITGAIRGTSRENLYQELELKSLKDRRWLRRMSYFYKIISTKVPPYLYEFIPPLQISHQFPGCFQTFRYFSKIRFYCLPLLNGINWILILKILIPMQCPVKTFDFYKSSRKWYIWNLWPTWC